MEVKERLYTVDDVFEMQGWDGTRDRRYELIDGELIEMSPTNLLHNWLALEIGGEIRDFVKRHNLGYAGVEGGFSPPGDRHNLYAPDVSFVSKARMPQPMPQTFAGFMPDLAVEIASPNNSARELRGRAEIFLRSDTSVVWIVYPSGTCAEICRLDENGELEIEDIDINGALTAEEVLPGFDLPLRKLFPAPRT